MTRFYFDLIDDGQISQDDEGVEFADAEIMQEQAMRAAGAMVSEKTRFPREPWAMVIRDQEGSSIATLTFAVR